MLSIDRKENLIVMLNDNDAMHYNIGSMIDFPLFQPIKLGDQRLMHRIALAPMTRTRADEATFAPTAQSVEY